MKLVILVLLLFVSGYAHAIEYVVIAADTNSMTVGQINALNAFQSEHFPPDMIDGSNKVRVVAPYVEYTDGTKVWRVNCFAVQHLEKSRRRIKYEQDGTTVRSDITYGKKVTAIRIANIREPFNGSQFKIERVNQGEQGSKLIEWGLSPVVTE